MRDILLQQFPRGLGTVAECLSRDLVFSHWAGGGAGASIELAFVLDATQSMGPHIDAVQRNVHAIVEGVKREIGECEVRCAVITYRDYETVDAEAPEEEAEAQLPAQVELDLTDDVGEVQRVLRGIEPRGGDDWAEDVAAGLALAGNLAWRKAALKMVILIGDAPAHGYLPRLAKDKGWSPEVFDNFPEGSPSGIQFPETVHAVLLRKHFIHFCAFGCEPGIRVVPGTDQMFRDFAEDGRYFVLSDASASALKDQIVTFVQESFDSERSEMERMQTEASAASQAVGGINPADLSSKVVCDVVENNAVLTVAARMAVEDARALGIISPHEIKLVRDAESGEPVVIGRGTFGTVYRGKLVRPLGDGGGVEELDVAVKEVLLPMQRNGRGLHEDSAREIVNLIRLSNSDKITRVVKMLGHCRAPLPRSSARQVHTVRPYYIVMPLMDKSLADAVGPPSEMSMQHWCKVLIDIAAGVESLHKEGYIHRDLKPENILLSVDGKSGRPRAFVADVGTARTTLRNEEQLAGRVGTAAFMAPELTDPAPGAEPEATAKSDIYSFGRIIEDCTEQCSTLEMSEAMKDFVRRMMAPNPINRPDITQVLNSLGQFSRDIGRGRRGRGK